MNRISKLFLKLDGLGLASRVFILLAAVGLFHGPAIFGGLFLDDGMNYLHARQSGWGFLDLCRSFYIDIGEVHDGFIPDEINHRVQYLRPLVILSFKAELALPGFRLDLFHLFNILLALGSAVCVMALAGEMLGSGNRGLAAGLLFISAPVSMPTVHWLSARTDLMATLFSLASLIFFHRFAIRRGAAVRQGTLSGGSDDSGAGEETARYPVADMALSCLLLGMALLSKESAAAVPALAFPVALLLPPNTQKGRGRIWPLRKALAATIPLWGVLAVYLVARPFLLGGWYVPKVHFYIFDPFSPGFLLYAVERVLISMGAMLFFLPGLPVKALLGFPEFHAGCAILAACMTWWAKKAVKAASSRENPDTLRVFASSWAMAVISLGPSLPLIPAPHYHYLPVAFVAIALAAVLPGPGSRNSAETGHSGSGGSWLSYHAAAWVILGLISAFIVHFAGWKIETVNRDLSDFMALELRAQRETGIPEAEPADLRTSPEKPLGAETGRLMVADVNPAWIHAFTELKLRHPESIPFEGYFVNILEPLAKPSIVEVRKDEIDFTTANQPYFSGVFTMVMVPAEIPFAEGKTLQNGPCTLTASKIARHELTGFKGISRLRLKCPAGETGSLSILRTSWERGPELLWRSKEVYRGLRNEFSGPDQMRPGATDPSADSD